MDVAQLVELRIVTPAVEGSNPFGRLVIRHSSSCCARVAELVDALDLGSSGATRESSSLSSRTTPFFSMLCPHISRQAPGSSLTLANAA